MVSPGGQIQGALVSAPLALPAHKRDPGEPGLDPDMVGGLQQPGGPGPVGFITGSQVPPPHSAGVGCLCHSSP